VPGAGRLPQLCPQLLYLRRLARPCLRALSCSGNVWLRALCHSLLELFNLIPHFNNVRMIIRVARLQCCKLVLQRCKQLLLRLWALAFLRRLPSGFLLVQQGFIEGLVLLRTAHRLGVRFQLRVHTVQQAQIRLHVFLKRAEM
jgi:hypothetical protein